MKKLILALFLVVGCSLCFAGAFEKEEKIVEDFLYKGTYVKILTVNSDGGERIIYFPKDILDHFTFSDGEIRIATVGEADSSYYFSIDEHTMSEDGKGNIIIKSKKL